MAIIQRYVIVETLKVFLVALVVTLALMTFGGGLKEGIRQGLPPRLVLQTLPYVAPEMLRFTVPGCLLFAVCSVFSRMAAGREIVAIKSLGINPLHVVRPVLMLAAVLSFLTFSLYDVCATWARPGLRNLVAQSLDQIAVGFLRSSGSFDAHGLSIIVRGVKEDRLQQPVISVQARGRTPAVVLTAEQAQLRTDRTTGMLHIECVNGEVEVAGKGAFRFPDRFSHDMQLQEPIEHAENHLSPAALACQEVDRQIDRERSLIAQLDRRLQDAPDGDDEQPEQLEAERNVRQARLYRLQAEVPRRLSNGMACLCFAMIGIPVAMRSHSSDVMSVFFLCFLPVLLIYYPLLVVGENMARDGTLPQLSVWLADGVLLVAGVMLFKKALDR